MFCGFSPVPQAFPAVDHYIITVDELLQAKTAAAQALRKQTRGHDQRHWAVY